MLDLRTLLSAIRRRWYLPLLFLVLSLVPVYLRSAGPSAEYQSSGLVMVLTPDDNRVINNQPDRYLLSQVEVLRGRTLAAEVAAALGDGRTADDVLDHLEVAHLAETDVVTVTASADTAEGAQELARTHLDTYFAGIEAAAEADRVARLGRLQTELAEAETELAARNAEIEAAGSALPDLNRVENLASLSLLEPDLVAEQAQLARRVENLTRQVDTLANEASPINTRIIQEPFLPSGTVVPPDRSLDAAVFVVFGLALGVAAAVLASQVSGEVRDPDAVFEIVGLPIEEDLPRVRALRRGPAAVVDLNHKRFRRAASRIASRAEALAPMSDSFRLAVVGTQREAGTSTAALAIAAAMAETGRRVVVVDADPRIPTLTRAFGAEGPGVSELVADPDGEARTTATGIDGVHLLGAGEVRRQVQRADVVPLFEALADFDAVVVDAGPALETATAAEWAGQADAAVLAIPLEHQKEQDLAVVSRQLLGALWHTVAVGTAPVLSSAGEARDRLRGAQSSAVRRPARTTEGELV